MYGKGRKKDTLEIGSGFLMLISIRLSGAHLLLKAKKKVIHYLKCFCSYCHADEQSELI